MHVLYTIYFYSINIARDKYKFCKGEKQRNNNNLECLLYLQSMSVTKNPQIFYDMNSYFE